MTADTAGRGREPAAGSLHVQQTQVPREGGVRQYVPLPDHGVYVLRHMEKL